MSARPKVTLAAEGDVLVARFDGSWIARRSRLAEAAMARAMEAARGTRHAVLDLDAVDRLDTAGAWIVARARRDLGAAGVSARIETAREEHRVLVDEVDRQAAEPPAPRGHDTLTDLLADIGRAVTGFGANLSRGTAVFGEFVAALIRVVLNPARLRGTSLVFHLEQIGLRSVPIIALISFLVGAIVAQQGIFQLTRFGATTFVVDLVGILTLRELAPLLTAIMIAGRSGSAITAEIGSMRMREEIDALRVMGLDPMEVLILPRVLALVIALPILAFIGAMAALFGAMVTAVAYGGLTPDIFLARLQGALSVKQFLVGQIKAPFMALVIGLIAAMEGLAVEGSAESLGRQTTASVVKSIFMVIVVDAVFALFFSAIRY